MVCCQGFRPTPPQQSPAQPSHSLAAVGARQRLRGVASGEGGVGGRRSGAAVWQRTVEGASSGGAQEAEAQKEQQELQRELQEWTAAAQCKAIDALSPEQVRAAATRSKFIHTYVFIRRVSKAVENHGCRDTGGKGALESLPRTVRHLLHWAAVHSIGTALLCNRAVRLPDLPAPALSPSGRELSCLGQSGSR